MTGTDAIGTMLLMRTLLSLAVLAGCPVVATADPADPVVTVADGSVRGQVVDGVSQWLGIPFASPPTGANRWRAPQPAARWTGVRDATRYGHDCMQLPFPSDAAPLGTTPSEDCLVLNVWAPPKAKDLPVVVWIYGGGFVNGGSSPPTYSGASLARKGVLFVSFNYRLGRFGTFIHPALRDESSGNFGYLDQLAALRWVRANISAFGGNPANVTIMGESAGGMSVNTLVTSPAATGLFHRAVVMSGGNGETGDATRAAAERASIAFGVAEGISADDPAAAAKLRALPADQVVGGMNLGTLFRGGKEPRSFASPYPDGQVAVPVAPAYRAGTFVRVPIMIGATSNDIGGPDGAMLAGAGMLAATISAAGAPTYYYRFSYVAQSLPIGAGAGHATDIPFFLDTQAVKYGSDTTERDRAVGRTISRYVVNFARTGNPNGKGLPNWSAHTSGGGLPMEFAADGRAMQRAGPSGAEK